MNMREIPPPLPRRYSKEPLLTRRYWERVCWEKGRGTLLEEYCVVRPREGVSPRWIDGIIILDGNYRIAPREEHGSLGLSRHDLIVVQTKTGRLGMYLLGQALFSRELIREHFSPRSVRTVALCGRDDDVLRPIAAYFGIEVAAVDKDPSLRLPEELRNAGTTRT
jgi:hypothetical protein